MQAIRDCLTSYRSKYEKKELVVKARISIATVTKMGKDSAVVVMYLWKFVQRLDTCWMILWGLYWIKV